MKSFLFFGSAFLAVLHTIKVCECVQEGDIAVPNMTSGNSSAKGAFVKDVNQLWDGGVIPYKFQELQLQDGGWEPLFRTEDKELINQVLDHIMDNVPCLQFR